MAAQNNTGMIITLSVSMVLTVALAVFTWMTYRTNTDLAQKSADLEQRAGKAESELRNQMAQVASLKQVISGSDKNPAEAVEKDVAETVDQVKKTISTIAGDGSDSNPGLESALVKTAAEHNLQKYSADDRMAQLNQKAFELQKTIERRDSDVQTQKDATLRLEEELRKQEAQKSEQLASMKKLVDELREEQNALQERFNTTTTQKDREIDDLREDLDARRNTIVVLRQKLFEQEDLSFDKADGAVKFVDQDSQKCYINIGSLKKIQEGATFSVYTKSNNGVGRRNTEDVKGKIEVVSIMGPNLSEARIVQQDMARPLAAEDPIYSPLFAAGRELRIAVVGNLDFDGNAGSDADEFRRVVERAGAVISVQTSPKGELLDGKGQPLNDELKSRISEQTRFLVVADTGKDSETLDAGKRADYNKIEEQRVKMEELALSHGVYVISLSSFLEFIGYTKKVATWTPDEVFPVTLANGAKSSSTSAGLGQRSSSAAISGAFSSRRKARSFSTGQTSKMYKPSAQP